MSCGGCKYWEINHVHIVDDIAYPKYDEGRCTYPMPSCVSRKLMRRYEGVGCPMYCSNFDPSKEGL